jgi:hypothetical protein
MLSFQICEHAIWEVVTVALIETLTPNPKFDLTNLIDN